MGISECFLIFSSEDKILALKMTCDWSSCEAFIYNLKEKSITYHTDQGEGSMERKFFSKFSPLPPQHKILESELPHPFCGIWIFRPSDKVLNYSSLEDELKLKSNGCKDINTELYADYLK